MSVNIIHEAQVAHAVLSTVPKSVSLNATERRNDRRRALRRYLCGSRASCHVCYQLLQTMTVARRQR